MKNTSNKLNITYRNALAEVEYIINHLPQESKKIIWIIKILISFIYSSQMNVKLKTKK